MAVEIFRVIIAGGRQFNNLQMMTEYMDSILVNQNGKKIVIVCGKAKGADTLGEQYAKLRGYEIEYYPADWDKYKKAAGYKRNAQMAQVADALVAFWDGVSKGTKHMIDIMNDLNKPYRVCKYKVVWIDERRWRCEAA